MCWQSHNVAPVTSCLWTLRTEFMVSLLILSELMEVIAGDKGHPREGAPEPTKPAHRGSPAQGET